MMNILKGFIGLVFCVAVSKAFDCSKDATLFNDDLNIEEISRFHWLLIASSSSDDTNDRPFKVPMDSAVDIKVEYSTGNSSLISYERLTFWFYCVNNLRIRTFTEINKHYDWHKKQNQQTAFRYCSDTNILGWNNLYARFHHEEELLMFYVCNLSTLRATEFFIMLGTKKYFTEEMKSKSDQSTRNFLTVFNSTLLQGKNLTYVNYQEQTKAQCENFQEPCIRDDFKFSATYSISPKNVSFVNGKFYNLYAFFGPLMVFAAFILGFVWIYKIKIKRLSLNE